MIIQAITLLKLNNPTGPILKGDGLVQDWLGNSSFEIGTFCLAVIRCPAFFETFPVIPYDEGGTVRADIGFRRASSLNSIEQRYDLTDPAII